ncbi:MAG: hypothetical protein Q8N90_04495 [bacterium]|nr:hypothetical protein [bacterium]
MTKKFNYEIIVNALIPPIGGVYKYCAKVTHIYQDMGTKEKEVSYDFGETHGGTKEDAEQKIREIVEKWIEDQNK